MIEEIHFSEIARTFRSRKWFILGGTLLLTGLVLLSAFLLPVDYLARTRIDMWGLVRPVVTYVEAERTLYRDFYDTFYWGIQVFRRWFFSLENLRTYVHPLEDRQRLERYLKNRFGETDIRSFRFGLHRTQPKELPLNDEIRWAVDHILLEATGSSRDRSRANLGYLKDYFIDGVCDIAWDMTTRYLDRFYGHIHSILARESARLAAEINRRRVVVEHSGEEAGAEHNTLHDLVLRKETVEHTLSDLANLQERLFRSPRPRVCQKPESSESENPFTRRSMENYLRFCRGVQAFAPAEDVLVSRVRPLGNILAIGFILSLIFMLFLASWLSYRDRRGRETPGT